MAKLPEFGRGSDADQMGYTMELLTGWLESTVEHEAEACEASKNIHRLARLNRAYDGIQAFSEVMEWTPKLTKHYAQRK